MVAITCLSAEESVARQAELRDLLQDAVAGGASVGFVWPLAPEVVEHYWHSVIAEVAKDTKVLLVAQIDGQIVGAVQLAPAGMPNGAHRAEVQKLLVLRRARRQGIGRALIAAVEAEARTRGRYLLVLDTVKGQPPERLYEQWGYVRCGEIPDYARSTAGSLEATVLFYRQL
ncbi:MAG: GNAT family N-acetyltransferase [Herpetosiphon sp.]